MAVQSHSFPCWQYRVLGVNMAVHGHMSILSDEETMLVETVREFIDRDVKPTVREVEHANAYPEAWIEQMKRIGIYGLAVPEEYGGTPVSMPLLCAGHPGTGPRLDEPGRRDGRAHRGRQADRRCSAPRSRNSATCRDGHRRDTGDDGPDRARRWFRSAGHDHHGAARRHDLVINGAKTWITNARRSGLIALLCKTDPDARAQARGISVVCRARRTGLTVSRDLPKLGYKGVETANWLLRLPRTCLVDPRW